MSANHVVPERRKTVQGAPAGCHLALAFALLLAGQSIAARADDDQIFLSQSEALRLVCGVDATSRYDPRTLPEPLVSQLQRDRLWYDSADLGSERRAHFYRCERNGKIAAYALIDREIGKHLPITYIVGFSSAGAVSRVEMMVFREVRGWEPRERIFMSQFEGRIAGAPLRVGKEIRNVAGATYSAKSIAKGVARALALWKYFYGSAAPGAERVDPR